MALCACMHFVMFFVMFVCVRARRASCTLVLWLHAAFSLCVRAMPCSTCAVHGACCTHAHARTHMLMLMLMLMLLHMLMLMHVLLFMLLLHLMACAIVFVLAGPIADDDDDFVVLAPPSFAAAAAAAAAASTGSAPASKRLRLAAPTVAVEKRALAGPLAADFADFVDSPSWVPAMTLGPASTPPTIATGAAATAGAAAIGSAPKAPAPPPPGPPAPAPPAPTPPAKMMAAVQVKAQAAPSPN